MEENYTYLKKKQKKHTHTLFQALEKSTTQPPTLASLIYCKSCSHTTVLSMCVWVTWCWRES